MLAFLFPGQGSLRPGMGQPWTAAPSWALLDELSDVWGRDLADLLLSADAATITATGNAQPATFALSMVALDHLRRRRISPDAVAGHSLGEYSALVASGVLSAHVAMRLVGIRATAMQAAADAAPGTMAAVLGLEADKVAGACADAGDAWVANDNAPGQIVIAGTLEGVAAAGEAARARGASRVVPLQVGGAFHSPLMAPAQAMLDAALEVADFSSAAIPVVTNVDATDHLDGKWSGRLSAQLCQRVRWRESLVRLATLGVSDFVEVGPGEALTGMVKRTVAASRRHAVGSPEGAEALTITMAS